MSRKVRSSASFRRQQAQRRRKRLMLLLPFLFIAAVILLLVNLCHRDSDDTQASNQKPSTEVVEKKSAKGKSKCRFKHKKDKNNKAKAATGKEKKMVKKWCRIHPDDIPAVDIWRAPLVEMFYDLNDVHVEAAKRWGLDSNTFDEVPAARPELVEVYSTPLYVIDTLHHSLPYLIPDAQKLLYIIGKRFNELTSQPGPFANPDSHSYRIMVTSLLRTPTSVKSLRRVNRNASENSSHCYGTTFDISYLRFSRDDGYEDCDNLRLKMALAQVMYELRYEGLCYALYERRQPCFHITLRFPGYTGKNPTEPMTFDKALMVKKELPYFDYSTLPVVKRPAPAPKVKKAKRGKTKARRRKKRGNYITY